MKRSKFSEEQVAYALRQAPLHRDVMTAAELARFLAVVAERRPGLYPYFFTLARSGLRPGEALGLRWEDVDLDARVLHVRRSGPGTTKTKTGEPRTVEVSPSVA